MRRPALLAAFASLPLVLAAQSISLDDDADGALELNEGERAAAELARKKAAPPKLVKSWNFDAADPKSKELPSGWGAGTWGERKTVYGTEPVEPGSTNRAMKIDVRYIVGGELQIFSYPWKMLKGNWYRVSFRAKGFDHPGAVTVMVRKYSFPWSELAWPGVSFHPENEWKEYSIVKQSGHTISSDFGILIKTGSVGTFLIDDVKVEEFEVDPRPADRGGKPVPAVKGNLVPRRSFEARTDPFWADESIGGGAKQVWHEPHHDIVEGGHDGARCLRLRRDKLPNGGQPMGLSVWSIPIPVATGRVYTVSCWAKTTDDESPFSVGVEGGEEPEKFGFYDSCNLARQGGWRYFTATSKPVPPHIREVRIHLSGFPGREVFVDSLSLSLGPGARRSGEPGKFVPAAPCELELNFASGDPLVTPRVVTWGEKLPLEIGAWPAAADCAAKEVPATLRVTAYPDTVAVERKVVLKVGASERLDLDPNANGVLRVELVPDDPALAKPIEVVMARLPKPRATGAKGRFGSHMRACPAILDYARAIGLTWHRLHDCCTICKMKVGNPEKGVYRWEDEVVDGIRARGFSILAMPDAPAGWMVEKKWVMRESEKKKQAEKDEELDLSATDADEEVDGEGGIVSEMNKKQAEADMKLKSDLITFYDSAAYGTWCRELAKHYKGRIEHFEIWNEPYMPDFYKGTMKNFGELFHAGAMGIRAGNPDAKVVGWCTEMTAPQFVNSFLKDYPAKDRPDINSLHCYFMGIPGDGEVGYELLLDKHRQTYGEYAGKEIWDTEGNLGGASSFYSYAFSPRGAANEAAFGVRGWSEMFFSGVARLFIYSMHNTDAWRNGGYMSTIDYDRSVNVWAAATATTAYFIDAMEPHREIKSPAGVKLRVFSGCGRTSAVLFDDCLVRGRLKLDAAKLPKGWLATDAMGNDLRPRGAVELGPVPVLVLRPEEGDPKSFASTLEDALVK